MRQAEVQVVDALGLKCPLPVLMMRRALARAVPGAVVEVLADDPLAQIDIPHACAADGAEIVSQNFKAGCAVFRIRKVRHADESA